MRRGLFLNVNNKIIEKIMAMPPVSDPFEADPNILATLEGNRQFVNSHQYLHTIQYNNRIRRLNDFPDKVAQVFRSVAVFLYRCLGYCTRQAVVLAQKPKVWQTARMFVCTVFEMYIYLVLGMAAFLIHFLTLIQDKETDMKNDRKTLETDQSSILWTRENNKMQAITS